MANIEVRVILEDKKKQITNSLKDLTFVIKEYQRGYRWEKSQIECLLDDIDKFETESGKLKYCLQPLVVKKLEGVDCEKNSLVNQLNRSLYSNNKEYWELIDGQQRLTTILLILNECSSSSYIPYDVIYVNNRKMDSYYIEQAKKIIADWFKNNSADGDIEDYKHEIKAKIQSSVQFIWYEVPSQANSSEVFTKINMGKVPLTNAELFKALLLKESGGNSGINAQTQKIAIEWDNIEQSLHDNEFWLFISNQLNNAETRIDYLLRLYANVKKNQVNNKFNTADNLFPFLVINELIASANDVESQVFSIWEDLVKIFDTLKEWYENSLIYHKIGFLIATEAESIKLINYLIENTYSKKKSENMQLIDKLIKDKFANINLDELDYTNSKDKSTIRKVLLFFNIYTMIKSKTKTRFSFSQYKCSNWDIEHIHARATEEELLLASKTVKKDLLQALIEQLADIGNVNKVQELKDFLNNKLDKTRDDEFVEFYNQVIKEYGDFNSDGLGNLTLLDSETNRSYKNAIFPRKRKIIIERDKGETFIPVCTKNVFLKMYSTDKGRLNMMAWNEQDATAYLDEIKHIFMEAKII